MEKYFYIEELCPVCHYRGLFPAVYEKTGEGYRKRRMCCRILEEGRCHLPQEECQAFAALPELLPRDQEWKLCENLLGRE